MSEMYLLPTQQQQSQSTTRSANTVHNPSNNTLTHTPLAGLHTGRPGGGNTGQRQSVSEDNNSVMYYVLEQPPVYGNNNTNSRTPQNNVLL